MAKQDYGTKTGECPICDINCWTYTGAKPAIWPCNIEKCPYEDPKKQNRHFGVAIGSSTGSGLAQIDF